MRRGCVLADDLRAFGRLPMADRLGYPTPTFQASLAEVVRRLGGTEGSSIVAESVDQTVAVYATPRTSFETVPVTAAVMDFDLVPIPEGHNTDLETV